MYTISWSAFPMSGNVVTLLTLDVFVFQGISQVFYLFWLVCLLFDVGYDHQLCLGLGVDYVVLVLVFRKRMMGQTNQYDQAIL